MPPTHVYTHLMSDAQASVCPPSSHPRLHSLNEGCAGVGVSVLGGEHERNAVVLVAQIHVRTQHDQPLERKV